MKIPNQLITRVIAFCGLALTLVIACSEVAESYHGFFDLRAAVLVFLAPILVLALFGGREPQLRAQISRLRQLQKSSHREVVEELLGATAAARGQYGYSHTVRFSESHKDPMVRYAGSLFSGRFSPEELSRLLAQSIQAEDEEWQSLTSSMGFLAKMAPYFGMLATVIGMIKLLENMSDFSKISGSMALAMQGTLYGLVSFTLLYSPLQRYISVCREELLKRNELIARWFILLSQQADPVFIEHQLRSLASVGNPLSIQSPIATEAAPARGTT